MRTRTGFSRELVKYLKSNDWAQRTREISDTSPTSVKIKNQSAFLAIICLFTHTEIQFFPQKCIIALDKFELRTTRVHRKYYLVKAARQSYSWWPRKSPRKHKCGSWSWGLAKTVSKSQCVWYWPEECATLLNVKPLLDVELFNRWNLRATAPRNNFQQMLHRVS